MLSFLFFFFNDTATTEIYTLSLHDALPISMPPHIFSVGRLVAAPPPATPPPPVSAVVVGAGVGAGRSEEHTSELQSQSNLVCRLLLEKKKKKKKHDKSVQRQNETNPYNNKS